MDADAISLFLGENRGVVCITAGALFAAGAARNWNWLCDPAGKPYAHLLGRTGRRIFFFAAGCLLIACGVMIEFHF